MTVATVVASGLPNTGKRCLIAVVRGLYEGASSSPGIVIQAS